MNRRHFLGLAGFSALSFVAKGSLDREGGAPATQPPGVAPRWGMVIDPTKCRELDGCTRCIAACHRAHNVPQIGSEQHELKWIWKEPIDRVFPREQSAYTHETAGFVLPVLCNHCENPPCVRVCPTRATWKRADGIVMMDFHRCIGCRYCMAACPYGSRSFNWDDPRSHLPHPVPDYPTRTKGVVEKCTFCEERLARSEPPLCVTACPEHALVFGDLRDAGSRVRELLRARHSMRRKVELGTEPSVFYLI